MSDANQLILAMGILWVLVALLILLLSNKNRKLTLG